jgi:cholesterol transport system auxiliary component
LLLLSGCSLLPKSEAILRLDPHIQSSPGTYGEPAALTVAVVRPATDPARDSNRVQVRTSAGELQVLGRLRWIAPAPDLVQSTLIRHLRDTGAVADASADAAFADRMLQIDLRQFEIAEIAGGHQVVLVLDARWIETATGEVLRRRLIEHRGPIDGLDGARVVAAFEHGLGEVAEAIARRTLD